MFFTFTDSKQMGCPRPKQCFNGDVMIHATHGESPKGHNKWLV